MEAVVHRAEEGDILLQRDWEWFVINEIMVHQRMVVPKKWNVNMGGCPRMVWEYGLRVGAVQQHDKSWDKTRVI
jgi:hypothetical protein